MLILLGIIVFHWLAIIRTKWTPEGKPPYLAVAIVTALMVGYVFYMLMQMQPPTP